MENGQKTVKIACFLMILRVILAFFGVKTGDLGCNIGLFRGF
jgi:hypothetical protein